MIECICGYQNDDSAKQCRSCNRELKPSENCLKVNETPNKTDYDINFICDICGTTDKSKFSNGWKSGGQNPRESRIYTIYRTSPKVNYMPLGNGIVCLECSEKLPKIVVGYEEIKEPINKTNFEGAKAGWMSGSLQGGGITGMIAGALLGKIIEPIVNSAVDSIKESLKPVNEDPSKRKPITRIIIPDEWIKYNPRKK